MDVIVKKDEVASVLQDEMTAAGAKNGTEGAANPGVVVRGEEIGIVLIVLILWVGAIILFFNRWGKIRMLEPYQPKFCEHHNPNCPMADVPPLVPQNNYAVSTVRNLLIFILEYSIINYVVRVGNEMRN